MRQSPSAGPSYVRPATARKKAVRDRRSAGCFSIFVAFAIACACRNLWIGTLAGFITYWLVFRPAAVYQLILPLFMCWGFWKANPSAPWYYWPPVLAVLWLASWWLCAQQLKNNEISFRWTEFWECLPWKRTSEVYLSIVTQRWNY